MTDVIIHIYPGRGKEEEREFYNKKEFDILYISSFFGFLSVFVSYKCKLYIHTFFSLLLTLSSLLYWYKPGKCFRRLIDHTVILIATLHHSYSAYKYNFMFYFFALYMMYVIYKISYNINKESEGVNANISAYYHFFLHLFANISNIMLYLHICNKIKK